MKPLQLSQKKRLQMDSAEIIVSGNGCCWFTASSDDCPSTNAPWHGHCRKTATLGYVGSCSSGGELRDEGRAGGEGSRTLQARRMLEKRLRLATGDGGSPTLLFRSPAALAADAPDAAAENMCGHRLQLCLDVGGRFAGTACSGAADVTWEGLTHAGYI